MKNVNEAIKHLREEAEVAARVHADIDYADGINHACETIESLCSASDFDILLNMLHDSKCFHTSQYKNENGEDCNYIAFEFGFDEVCLYFDKNGKFNIIGM